MTAFIGVLFSAAGVLKIQYAQFEAAKVGRSLEVAFMHSMVLDHFSIYFYYLFLAGAGLSILMSVRYLEIEHENHGEFYSLILFSVIGMMCITSSFDIVLTFIGLELMAISTYVLVGFLRTDRRSNEAALKYLLLGASASSPMGVSLNYDDDIDMSAFIPSSSCTKASSTGLGLHLDTDPPPPYSESTTPINYARSALEMIREEPHGHDGMDFDFDDDEMPALEDTSLNLPSLPGSFPNFSKPFRKPSPSSAPNEGLPLPARPSNPTIKEEDTKQDDDARSFFSTSLSKDEPSRAPSNIHTSWDSSIWPPENPDEKSFCKRICSQVALFHGFKKVVIKSGIITMNTERLGTCVRHIYVEPHIVATFYVNPATQAERHKSKYYLRDSKKVERERGETVEIHVGREGWDIDDNLEEWGLWRKGGKEVLHWYAEWEEEYCG